MKRGNLVVHTNVEARRFLLDTGQKIVIAFAPAAEARTVVAAYVDRPFGDSTTIVIEPELAVYLSPRLYTHFETITVALSAPVALGQAYVFDGARVVADGAGVQGYVTVHDNAPPSATQPVTVGLSLAVHDAAAPALEPAPLDHFLLERFETRVLPAPGTTVLVFIASQVDLGMVLPMAILKPVAKGPSKATASAASAKVAIQAGRYLPVDLTASEQATIHFDLDAKAFAYGAYAP